MVAVVVAGAVLATVLTIGSSASTPDDRELRAQEEGGAAPGVPVIPPPPVQTPDDRDDTAPLSDDGGRTIVRPDEPNWPTGNLTGVGSVALDWNDVLHAEHYLVRLSTGTS